MALFANCGGTSTLDFGLLLAHSTGSKDSVIAWKSLAAMVSCGAAPGKLQLYYYYVFLFGVAGAYLMGVDLTRVFSDTTRTLRLPGPLWGCTLLTVSVVVLMKSCLPASRVGSRSPTLGSVV